MRTRLASAYAAAQLGIIQDADETVMSRSSLRVERSARTILHLFDGAQVAGLAVDNDVGDTTGRGAERVRPTPWPRG